MSDPAESPITSEPRRIARIVNDLPPSPRGIIADHAVPYGRAFKQWDTEGELWMWVNRGEVEDLPRSSWAAEIGVGVPFGIPVFYGHPLWRP